MEPKVKPVMMDTYITDLKERLNKKFDKKTAYDSLSSLLKETGAILAGGFVLQIIAKYEVSHRLDMDFYCPTKNIPNFIKKMASPDEPGKTGLFERAIQSNTITASLYCSSFLQRNGIRKIYTFSQIEESPEAISVPLETRRKEYPQMIDIMSVRNSRNVSDVVQNFDLTFCQVWWDGEHIWATHPEDILEKKGVLQNDYAVLFLQGNKFLRKRIQKYMKRGFNIKLENSNLGDINNNVICLNPTNKKNKLDDPIFKQRWVTRVLMRWILGNRDNIKSMSSNEKRELTKVGINLEEILFVPRGEHAHKPTHPYRASSQRLLLPNQEGNINEKAVRSRYGRADKSLVLEPDDGYDSEDYIEIDNLKNLAKQKYETETPGEEINKDLAFYRKTNKLLQIILYPINNGWEGGDSFAYIITNYNKLIKNLETRIARSRPGKRRTLYLTKLETFKKLIVNSQKYVSAITEACTRKGECFIMKTDDETVYDIHDHPMEGAISQDGLEGYLREHIRDVDKTNVPCYYKPNAPSAQNPRPHGNCYKNITMSEVNYIVSEPFWKRYSSPTPIKTGLSETISMWDTILTNVKTHDNNYGDIYNKTICPYCLQFYERDSGCAYLTHDNPSGRSPEESPYCQKDFLIQEIRDKYIFNAKNINEGVPPHLEWCVECGRPSVGHEHFTTSEPYGLETAPMIPNPHNPQQQIHDYGKCSGGGRPELYARILAIRRVYRDMGITNPKDERMVAAMAADEAPNDPELMAQGRAIYEKEIAERKWGNADIPQNKIYNDPTYKEQNNNTQEGGTKRKTRKFNNRRRKVSMSKKFTEHK